MEHKLVGIRQTRSGARNMTPDDIAFCWPRIRLLCAFTAAKLLYIGVGCFIELGRRATAGPWW